MAVYNTNPQWLRKSIESILNQTFKNFEFLIVLDVPTDDSESIVREYSKKDSRIRVIQNKENLGLTKSLNIGIASSKGRYIARMDSDDISLPDRFIEQYQYLEEHPDVAAVGSLVFTKFKNIIFLDSWTSNEETFKIRTLFGNAGIPHPTAMIRKSVLTAHNVQYDERYRKSQDYKLWLDLMPYGKIDTILKPLLYYRVHENQLSAKDNDINSCFNTILRNHFQSECGDLDDASFVEFSRFCSNDTFDRKVIKKVLKNICLSNKVSHHFNNKLLKKELNYNYQLRRVRTINKKRILSLLFDPWMLKLLWISNFVYFSRELKSVKNRKRIINDAVDNSLISIEDE